MKIPKDPAADLKATRLSVKWTQQQFCKHFGISQAALSRKENGERKVSHPEATLVRIAFGTQREADRIVRKLRQPVSGS
jgi:transcriptional regulator with XRE-family HTH domain